MTVKILGRHPVAQTRIFSVEQLDLEFSNGAQCQFERVTGRTSEAVMIVPFRDPETILLIREYAPAIEDYHLGFPKGGLEPGEDPQACADRELMEEIGYTAKRYQKLGVLTASPGYVCSNMHTYLATDLVPKTLEGDEPEPLEVVPWAVSEVDALLAHPEFHEGRSIAALWLAMKSKRT